MNDTVKWLMAIDARLKNIEIILERLRDQLKGLGFGGVVRSAHDGD